MASERERTRLAIIERGSYGLALFEVVGANSRDGERYVRFTVGGVHYAMTAEVAQQLGAELIMAAGQLPDHVFEKPAGGNDET